MLTVAAVTASGPVLLETFLKHYFSRKVKNSTVAREELLYDEAFVLIKTFLEISTKHTVEDIQKFGLTRTPSPPWVLLHRVLIPLNPTCTRAADLLVQALGGPEWAMKMAGGSKWWTVRMQAGVEAEWIGIKKDWREAEMKLKQQEEDRKKRKGRMARSKESFQGVFRGEKEVPEAEGAQSDDGLEGEFTAEMDHLRCMLYIHGGAGYWGSINTHRYTIWRYARKMRGRCFAVNYRKAPQFPWPCALHDCIAAYLYLIDPPPTAKHRPVDPKNVIIAGDSAGGNLALSLLQVIRDVGLPAPGGAVLISPWTDLTHSFPSVLENTPTDIIPPYGFLHRPSTLWPPPPPEMTEKVQDGLRSKVKEAVNRLTGAERRRLSRVGSRPAVINRDAEPIQAHDIETATQPAQSVPEDEETTGRGDTKVDDIVENYQKGNKDHEPTLHPTTEKGKDHHPGPTTDNSVRDRNRRQSVSDPAKSYKSSSDPAQEKHTLTLELEGKTVHIRSQIQLYCTNDQLSHPYVSPALGNLAGLPPLMVIASDKEVLRDEIIYTAHKAARPDQYPIRQGVKDLLPSLKDCEGKYPPTKVHLQVYDGTCHVLPMISFTEPAKHCYRAIASWCKFVTTRHPDTKESTDLRRAHDDTRANTTISSVFDSAPSKGPSPQHTPFFASPAPTRSATLATDTDASTPADSYVELGLPLTDGAETIPPPQSIKSASESVGSEDFAVSTRANSTQTKIKDGIPFLPDMKRRMSPVGTISGENSRAQSGYTSQVDLTDDEDAGASVLQSPRLNAEKGGASSEVDNTILQDEIKVPKNIPEGFAGNYDIYQKNHGKPFDDGMIRERVSTHGECRPLEDPKELQALNMPLELTGVVKEAQAVRYLTGQALWDEKYKKSAKKAEKHRQDNLKKAHHDIEKAENEFKQHVQEKKSKASTDPAAATFDEKSYIFDGDFSWSWALKGEQPPPSACVGRRDTTEARHLAKMADKLTDESVQLSGLSLWTAMASMLSKMDMTAVSNPEKGEAHAAAATSSRSRLFGRAKKAEA